MMLAGIFLFTLATTAAPTNPSLKDVAVAEKRQTGLSSATLANLAGRLINSQGGKGASLSDLADRLSNAQRGNGAVRSGLADRLSNAQGGKGATHSDLADRLSSAQRGNGATRSDLADRLKGVQFIKVKQKRYKPQEEIETVNEQQKRQNGQLNERGPNGASPRSVSNDEALLRKEVGAILQLRSLDGDLEVEKRQLFGDNIGKIGGAVSDVIPKAQDKINDAQLEQLKKERDRLRKENERLRELDQIRRERDKLLRENDRLRQQQQKGGTTTTRPSTNGRVPKASKNGQNGLGNDIVNAIVESIGSIFRRRNSDGGSELEKRQFLGISGKDSPVDEIGSVLSGSSASPPTMATVDSFGKTATDLIATAQAIDNLVKGVEDLDLVGKVEDLDLIGKVEDLDIGGKIEDLWDSIFTRRNVEGAGD